MIRVSSETYDKAWLVNTTSKKRAIKLVKELTESYGWHLDFPEEKRKWSAEELFTKNGEIIEATHL